MGCHLDAKPPAQPQVPKLNQYHSRTIDAPFSVTNSDRSSRMSNDSRYHLERARAERDIAYRAADLRASDAHMRLSALHLSRAMVLEEVDRRLGEATVTLRSDRS
jgi:hypothetical protein